MAKTGEIRVGPYRCPVCGKNVGSIICVSKLTGYRWACIPCSKTLPEKTFEQIVMEGED